jgi:hypothetical protein
MARLFSILVLLIVLTSGRMVAQNDAPASPGSALPSAASGAHPSGDSCTPEKPIAGPQETIRVRLWTASDTSSPQYVWTATAGHIEGHGAEALWDLSGAPAGYATATVGYKGPSGPASCSLQVVIEESAGERGPVRDRGHDLLVKNTPETPGYGLYSYVLFSAAPDDQSRPRYLQLLQAVLAQTPSIEELGVYYDLGQLNVTYIPVVSGGQPPVSAQWLLDTYDYAHARFLLHSVPGDLSRGPYLVSSLHPLGKATSGPYLVQDLSSVPPHLVSLWTGEFLNQAAQEHFWEQGTGTMLALRMRTAIGIMAEGLPDVRKSLESWISMSK